MRGVMGILLVGGGVFLLIALFNGTLKFPLGNINPSGSSNIFGGSPPSVQVPPGKNPVVPKQSNGKCPPGYSPNPKARSINAECIYTG